MIDHDAKLTNYNKPKVDQEKTAFEEKCLNSLIVLHVILTVKQGVSELF